MSRGLSPLERTPNDPLPRNHRRHRPRTLRWLGVGRVSDVALTDKQKAPAKRRLREISEELDAITKKEGELSRQRQALRDEQRYLNSRVYNA